MTHDHNIATHRILEALLVAKSEGEALDLVPSDWSFFVSGPDAQGCHCSIRPAAASETVRNIYDRGLGMGRGDSRQAAIRNAARWVLERTPKPDETLATLKNRAIALVNAAETLDRLFQEIEHDGENERADFVNVEVRRLMTLSHAAQIAILLHLERGDHDGWNDGHPLNERLWRGVASVAEIHEYV